MASQVVLALADAAMVLALASELGGFRPVSTIDITGSFLRTMRDVGTKCEVEILFLARQMAFLRVMLYERNSSQIAAQVTATTSFRRLVPMMAWIALLRGAGA